MEDSNKPNIDINGDGNVDQKELDLHVEREQYQRRMSYIALAGIIGTCAYLVGFADIDRVSSVSELLDMYFITLAGIVATSMGVGAWATKRK